MFSTRVLSGIALVVLMVAGVFAGNAVFTALFTIISIIGMMELYKIYNMHKSILGCAGYLCAVIFDALLFFQLDSYASAFLVFSLILLMIVYVVEFPKYTTDQMMMSYLGLLYVNVMLSFVFRIRALDNGVILVWLVFICSWVNDTCAYLVGVMFGKHKMTPKLSPKKSYEGAVGGILGTAIVAAIYGFVFKNQLSDFSNSVVVFAIAGGLGAFISIFGDLAASGIKRNHDVKDYGNIIPGHGGVMDRFDSMVFIAPVIYYVLIFMMNLK